MKPIRHPKRRERGSAMIETTIIMPAYCIVILGVIFFGNLMLGRQKQRAAVWYVGLSGAEDAQRLDDVFCKDIEGELQVSPDSGINDNDPFSEEDLELTFKDLSQKHVIGDLVMGPGGLERVYREVDDYSSSFMERMADHIDQYKTMVADALNRDSQGRVWMARTRADVSYDYQPPFADLIFSNPSEPLTSGQYLALDAPKTSLELKPWESRFRMMIRYNGQRDEMSRQGAGGVTGPEMLDKALLYLSSHGVQVSAQARQYMRVFENSEKIRTYWKPGGPALPPQQP